MNVCAPPSAIRLPVWRTAIVTMAMILGPLPTAETREVPAFPGAQGWGATTAGGRNGKVLFVTNLDDYDPKAEKPIPGSLRAACSEKGPRTVVFRISGTIALNGVEKIEIVIIGTAFGAQVLTAAGDRFDGAGLRLRQSEAEERQV